MLYTPADRGPQSNLTRNFKYEMRPAAFNLSFTLLTNKNPLPYKNRQGACCHLCGDGFEGQHQSFFSTAIFWLTVFPSFMVNFNIYRPGSTSGNLIVKGPSRVPL